MRDAYILPSTDVEGAIDVSGSKEKVGPGDGIWESATHAGS